MPPPIIGGAIERANSGKTWTPVSAPKGVRSEDFGRFQWEGHACWAWWQSTKGRIAVEASTDRGAKSKAINPSRRTSHALLLGPVPAMNYGEMSRASKPIVVADQGAWNVLQSSVVNECATTQLATCLTVLPSGRVTSLIRSRSASMEAEPSATSQFRPYRDRRRPRTYR